MSLSLLTLNLAAPPVERAKRLLEYLFARDEQVLVLTETGVGRGSALIADVCRAAGWQVLTTPLTGSQRGVMVVGRDVSLTPDASITVPTVLPERVLGVDVAGVRLMAVYGAASDPVRYASAAQRQRKREWLVAFDAAVEASLAAGPLVVLGDLNIVDPVDTKAQRLAYVLTEELLVYESLTTRLGLVDAFRARHDGRQPSWRDHSGATVRYDHAFTTPDVPVAACSLDQTPLTEGLTDHAALVLELSDDAGRTAVRAR